MRKVVSRRVDAAARRGRTPRDAGPFPAFIEPQLTLLRDKPPEGPNWVHEIKYDGYRIHARIEGKSVRLLTRTGLDWTERYETTATALAKLKLRAAYIDGELCALGPDGVTSFALMQAATDKRITDTLIYFAFDLLHLDGEDLRPAPLVERKARLAKLLAKAPATIRYSEHFTQAGPEVLRGACEVGAEGIVSKRSDKAYAPGDRGIWIKTKCLNRQEFIIVGWTDPEGSRPHLGALLLGYYSGRKLLFAGRVGTGMSQRELAMLRQRLEPLAVAKMPLAEPPPRENRFGSPLELSRAHWVRPKLVCEVTYVTWTADGLLRHPVYQGLREDKAARDVKVERAG
jgi:bifunctional non-homologous end joining protein LigD